MIDLSLSPKSRDSNVSGVLCERYLFELECSPRSMIGGCSVYKGLLPTTIVYATMTNYSISVDWLQVYTLSNEGNLMDKGYTFTITTSYGKMEIEAESSETAMFKSLYTVKKDGIPYASIEARPRSSKLNPRMVLIKLANRVLYSTGYIKFLYELMQELRVTYKGITRIDLCYDCVRFKDDRSPAKFINQYVFGALHGTNQIAKKGREEFTCHGKKMSQSGSRINYISFGSPKSRIRSYIYDKTIELEEVKDKPWIRETWKKNGIKETDKNHVYRSEISIRSQGTDMLNIGTGELFRLSPIYLESQPNIERLFHFYAEKYLAFVNGTGQKRKKDYKRIFLYENRPEITCKPIHVSVSADTGRIEKICYNVLDRLSKTYVNLAEHERRGIDAAMCFLSELHGIKSGIASKEKYQRYLDMFYATKFREEHVLSYIDKIVYPKAKTQPASDNNSIKMDYLSMIDYSFNNEAEYNADIAYYLYMSAVKSEAENIPILRP